MVIITLRERHKFYIIIGLLILLLILEFVFLGGLELLLQLAQEVNAASENFIENVLKLIDWR